MYRRSFTTTLFLIIIAGMSCSKVIRPEWAAITDGMGARYNRCDSFEIEMADKGRKGYDQVVRLIRSEPDPRTLGVCLRCLASFYSTYMRNSSSCHTRVEEVQSIVHTLLMSTNRDYVAVAVVSIYYDFDNLYDDKTTALLETLRKNDDKYIAKFAASAHEQILVRTGVKPR